MFASLLIRWATVAASFAVTSWLLSGMEVSGGLWAYFWVSALFGVVNALIGTILRIVTLPFTLITLGLFALIVNAALLKITDALTDNLTIDEFFWTAIWAAIIISVVSVLIDVVVRLLVSTRERSAPR